MEKVSERLFYENGGNNPNTCLGLADLLDLHDENET